MHVCNHAYAQCAYACLLCTVLCVYMCALERAQLSRVDTCTWCVCNAYVCMTARGCVRVFGGGIALAHSYVGCLSSCVFISLSLFLCRQAEVRVGMKVYMSISLTAILFSSRVFLRSRFTALSGLTSCWFWGLGFSAGAALSPNGLAGCLLAVIVL